MEYNTKEVQSRRPPVIWGPNSPQIALSCIMALRVDPHFKKTFIDSFMLRTFVVTIQLWTFCDFALHMQYLYLQPTAHCTFVLPYTAVYKPPQICTTDFSNTNQILLPEALP